MIKRRRLVETAIVVGSISMATLGFATYAQAAKPASDWSIDALSHKQTVRDITPATIQLDLFGHEGGLVKESTRFLGSDESGAYYVALDAAGYICVLVDLGSSDLVVSSCAADALLSREGLGTTAFDRVAGKEVAFYLLPDGVNVDDVGPEYVSVGPNILRLAEPRDGTRTSNVLLSTDGSKMVLQPLPINGLM